MDLAPSERDAIATYLYKTFIQGEDCFMPGLIDNIYDSKTHTRAACYLKPPDFERTTALELQISLSLGVMAIGQLLGCFCDASVIEELLPKLEDVFKGRSQTLRPIVDTLLEKGEFLSSLNTTKNSNGIAIDIKDSELAWQQEYQGTAHVLLLQNIRRSYKKNSPYANSGSIIQSSGYGKSRTVDQMAMLIPTIPMNIRAESDAKQGAFPPADSALIKVFRSISASNDPVARVYTFFKVLFNLVRKLANDFDEQEFVMRLYRHFNNQEERAKFYAELLEILKQDTSHSTRKQVVESYNELAKLLPRNEEPLKMIVYVDEAHTLAPPDVPGPSMYDHMLRATADISSASVFFLFVSTASRLEDSAGQTALSSTARFLSSKDLAAPFTEMPFDCHPSLAKKPIKPELKLQEIQKFSFAVRFGRPLFWAYYEAIRGHTTELDAQTNTMAMAQEKLVGNTSLALPGDAGKLAILDTLLNLEYDPRRIHIHELASTMVASHLCTVYSVPTSCAYMHTGYPSEPVLAEAALTYVNSPDIKVVDPDTLETKTPTLRPLLYFYRDLDIKTAGAIDKGERGENVGKMVLLLAYIAAVKKHHNTQLPHKEFWGQGCSLVDFLTALTSDNFCQDVLLSTPDNVQAGLPLNTAFEKSWVRFTHFARAADDSAMTSSMAWIAFIRGMAMIGCHSQEAVDVSIPILLDKDKPITEANISSILVQFKVRSPRSAQDQVAIQEEKIKYFPPPNSRRDASANTSGDFQMGYHSRPYISMVMELGLVPPSDSKSIPSKIVHILDSIATGNKPTATPKKRSGTRHKPEALVSNVHTSKPQSDNPQLSSGPIHPRYSLFYYGCSHKVYRCILPEEDATCRILLQIPTVFNDRPSERPIDGVLQMKPFWNAGRNCFSWIEEPYFVPEDQSNKLDDDGVAIGNGSPMDVDEETNAMDET